MIRTALTAALFSLTAACGGQAQDESSPSDSGLTVSAERVVLFPDDPGRMRVGDLRYAGGVELSSADERFGGWSALHLSEDGQRVLAVSDRGRWMTASLDYDDTALAGLSDVHIHPLLNEAGEAVSGRFADSEGLANLGDGAYAVSFEREHRIWRYRLEEDWSAVETARPTPLPNPLGTQRLPNNAGMEGLAADGNWLWSAGEHTTGAAPVHILTRQDMAAPDAAGASFLLAMEAEFGLTALEPDDQGGLYILQRFWSRDVGNRIHILHLSAEQIADAANVTELHPTLLAAIEPEDMTVDNFEGMAVAEMNGETRLFLISDDNFNESQRTLLLSFTIEPRD